MRFFKIFLIITLIISTKGIQSQTLLKNQLRGNDVELSKKSYSINAVYIPNYLKYSMDAQSYFTYKNQLLLQIDGTGKLFKIEDSTITRIDSTVFEGGTFGAYNFVYRDTIFSLGGYGFWVFNGILRYYKTDKKEWSIIPTNLTFPINTRTYSKIWYDRKNQKLFVFYKNPELIYLKQIKNDNNYYLQCLDLKSKNWWVDPKVINTNFKNKFTDFFQDITISTKDGLIISSEKNIYLLDLNNNEIRNIDERKFQTYYDFILADKAVLFYEMNGKLYSLGNKFSQIDSLLYLSSNFKSSGSKIYADKILTNRIDNFGSYIIIIGLVILLTIMTFLYFKKKQVKYTVVNTDKNNTSFYDKLNEVEKSLLMLIASNSKKQLNSNIGQLNKVLGISNKPLKIQNNIRANTLMMINKKFMVFGNTQENLIEKKRTEDDKRFYEYFIQTKYLEFLK